MHCNTTVLVKSIFSHFDPNCWTLSCIRYVGMMFAPGKPVDWSQWEQQWHHPRKELISPVPRTWAVCVAKQGTGEPNCDCVCSPFTSNNMGNMKVFSTKLLPQFDNAQKFNFEILCKCEICTLSKAPPTFWPIVGCLSEIELRFSQFQWVCMEKAKDSQILLVLRVRSGSMIQSIFSFWPVFGCVLTPCKIRYTFPCSPFC